MHSECTGTGAGMLFILLFIMSYIKPTTCVSLYNSCTVSGLYQGLSCHMEKHTPMSSDVIFVYFLGL